MRVPFGLDRMRPEILTTARPAHVLSCEEVAVPSSRSNELTAKVLTRDVDFDAICEEWDQLVSDGCQQGGFFLRWHWNRVWWRMYRPPQSELFLIACRDQSGRLVGLAPLYRHHRSVMGMFKIQEICFIGTGTALQTSEHLDIIARVGYECLVGQVVAACIQQQPVWHRLWLWGIDMTSPVFPHFTKAFGDSATTHPCDRLPYVATRSDWATVRLGFGANFRTKIEQYLRRTQKDYKCQFCCVRTPEQFEEFMEAFVRLHQERWQSKGEHGSFAHPNFKEFIHETVREAFRCQRARLWMLLLNGQCVATLLAFVDRGVVHYFQGGFATGYERYSLGSVILALSIQDCLQDDDVNEFDFMGGGARYKDSWTTTAHEAVEVEILNSNATAIAYQCVRIGRVRLSHLYRFLLPVALRSAIRKHFPVNT